MRKFYKYRVYPSRLQIERLEQALSICRVLPNTCLVDRQKLTPRRVDLIVNMRIAREMSLTLPYPVLGSATRVIK